MNTEQKKPYSEFLGTFSTINKNIHVRTQNKGLLWAISILFCNIQAHFSRFQCTTGRMLRCCTSLPVWKHCLNPLSDWENKCLRRYSAILTQISGAPALVSFGIPEIPTEIIHHNTGLDSPAWLSEPLVVQKVGNAFSLQVPLWTEAASAGSR